MRDDIVAANEIEKVDHKVKEKVIFEFGSTKVGITLMNLVTDEIQSVITEWDELKSM